MNASTAALVLHVMEAKQLNVRKEHFQVKGKVLAAHVFLDTMVPLKAWQHALCVVLVHIVTLGHHRALTVLKEAIVSMV